MAEVFRAVAHGVEGFQRVFVIKRILKEKSASKEFIEMFVNEARISALLNHPNIVQIYDFGQIHGSYFLTMEHLQGKDLLNVLRQLHTARRLLSPGIAAYVAQQVASGLNYAHSLTQQGGKSLNIIHRDVSPSNIMLLRAGGVKLLDFGIAKATTEIRKSNTTQAGLLKGKLSYLSPEQVRAAGNIDGRADVFALGVVLWECLTGKRLFFDKTDFQTMKNVMERPVPPPSTQRADLPAALDYIVVRALERDLDRRYPNAKMMVDDLDSFLQDIRYSPAAMPRLLDELFGPDALQTETPQLPEATSHGDDISVSEVRAAVDAGPNPSVSVPPVAVSRAPAPGLGGFRSLLPRTRASRAAFGATGMVLALAVVVGLSMKKEPASAGASALAPQAAVLTPAKPEVALVPTRPEPAAAPVPGPNDEPAPAPDPSGTVTIRVDSEPTGAQVQGEDGAAMGVTPLLLSLPRSRKPIFLTVSKVGFVPSHQAITPDRDSSARLTLRGAEAAPRPRPVATTQRPRTRPAAAPHRAATGSDGKVREGLSIDPFAEESPGHQ